MSRGGSSPGGVHIVFSVSLERPGFPSLQTAQHCFRASPGGLWRVRAALDRWALWALSRRPCRCLRASPGGSGAESGAESPPLSLPLGDGSAVSTGAGGRRHIERRCSRGCSGPALRSSRQEGFVLNLVDLGLLPRRGQAPSRRLGRAASEASRFRLLAGCRAFTSRLPPLPVTVQGSAFPGQESMRPRITSSGTAGLRFLP